MKRLVTLMIVALFCVAGNAEALDPGVYDITVQEGEDYVLNLTHKANGLPVDLTGYSFRLQGKRTLASPVAFVTFSSAIVNPTAGQTRHWLTRAATRDRANTAGVYDLMQTAPGGAVSYPMKGTIKFMETVTQ